MLVTVEPGITVSIAAGVAEDMTYGEVGLAAPGGQKVTLVDAALVPIGSMRGLHVVDVVAAEPSRGSVRVSTGKGFPTEALQGKTRSVAEAPVPRPGDHDWTLGVELVFRLRADRTGSWRFSGVQVTYDVDGNRERQFISGPFRFCAPLTADCPTPPPAPAQD